MMQMAHKVGFTLDEAEILRRIVGKKKVEEVAEWKQKITDKIEENKLEPEIGDILWTVLEDSANYSFNKSHSIAYAALAACTIWLKFKYPKEFFVSLLEMSRHEQDSIKEVSMIHKEFHHFDLELHPPHIIKSKMDFNIEENGIRFGLLSIKGISEKSIEKLNNFKSEFQNKFEIFQAAEEAGVGISILCPLIQAGALEGFKQSRAKVAYEAQLWSILTKTEKKNAIPMAEEFDFDQYKDTFDIIFTSPPYFNVERYGYDNTQSWIRYKNIDDWNNNFLQNSIENMWTSLRSGGKLCVNIADVNAGSQGVKKKGWLKICDPMNNFINTFRDSDYLGCIGMEMAARPNSLGAGTGVETDENNRKPEMIRKRTGKFAEPIWIWEKK